MGRMLVLMALIAGCGEAADKGWSIEERGTPDREQMPSPNPDPEPQPTPTPRPDPIPEPEPDPTPIPVNPGPVTASGATTCETRPRVSPGDEWYVYDVRDAVGEYARACPLELVDDAFYFQLDMEGWNAVRLDVRAADPSVYIQPSIQVLNDGIARYYPSCTDDRAINAGEAFVSCEAYVDGIGENGPITLRVERPLEFGDDNETAKLLVVLSHYGQCATEDDCRMILTVTGED